MIEVLDTLAKFRVQRLKGAVRASSTGLVVILERQNKTNKTYLGYMQLAMRIVSQLNEYIAINITFEDNNYLLFWYNV